MRKKSTRSNSFSIFITMPSLGPREPDSMTLMLGLSAAVVSVVDSLATLG
nr:hypothetical protein [Salinispora arenicola]